MGVPSVFPELREDPEVALVSIVVDMPAFHRRHDRAVRLVRVEAGLERAGSRVRR